MPIIQMSASSISQVWGVTRSQVLEILKEIFAKFVDLSSKKEEIILDLKIGELSISEKNELIFKNKLSKRDKLDRKKEIIKAIKEAEHSYMNIKENPATNFDVEQVSSDMLSMHSGNSYYVSVRTPRTKTRSVASSRHYGNTRKRGKKWSLFKRNSTNRNPNMTRTASNGFRRSISSSSHKGWVSVCNSTSRSKILNPQKLFSNNGIIDKIRKSDSGSAYGNIDNRK